jgi:hypothetical protein
VSSQNRMNAGAEYVVYRIWAALQGQKGIHAESLIICLGALAGYACQVSVRQNAALPGADLRKHALMAVDASDGTTHFHGDALNLPLIQSPLSVWALVSRTVEKLGEPLPDIDDIASHVTETLGTRAFGSPRVSAGHGPRRPAVVYLRQVWPQIFPIAQRFCRKPAEMPVLFGIALQRAIEATRDVLDPKLSASIAMECAVAMSKVALPEDYSDPAIAWSSVIAKEMNAAPRVLATPAHESRSEPLRARVLPVRKRRNAVGAETGTPRVGTLIANLPPAARVATFVSLAIVAVAAVVYEGDRSEAVQGAREARTAASQASREASLPGEMSVLQVRGPETPVPEMSPAIAMPDESMPVAQAIQQQPTSRELDALSETAQEPSDFIDEGSFPEPASDGSDEIVIPEG